MLLFFLLFDSLSATVVVDVVVDDSNFVWC